MRLIVATGNKGKLKEIRRILKGTKLKIVPMDALNKKFHIKENGTTFLSNAKKKTLPVSKYYSDDLVVGEDSGLEVKYLKFAPGVRSKRYSGKGATDLKNNHKLLDALSKCKGRDRAARYRCCLVLAKGGKVVKVFNGILNGRIYDKMCGSNGFGYDPLFFVSKYGKTVAQLPLKIKNQISHRGQAFLRLKKYLTSI